MEPVNCDKIEKWGWECPDCGAWNEEDEENETVTCCECETEFSATFQPW